MDAREYQKLAARTINKNLNAAEQELHALFGMSSETGELLGLYQKKYQGHDMETEHVKKEVGDLLWMIAEFCTSWGWDLGQIMELNIDKLKKRYPEGFKAEQSINRKDGDV